jgi:hypothetical protein
MHPFTELAFNINSEVLPGFRAFLKNLKKFNLIPNITVNQQQFMTKKFQERLQSWVKDNLVFGIGVSLTDSSDEFIATVKKYPNVVIHVIAGIVCKETMDRLSNKGLKILILGFKSIGRGKNYHHSEYRMEWLKGNVMKYAPKFKVISFDNLALKQLHIKEQMSPKAWAKFFMGNDGMHTFYLDLAKKQYAKSSLETEYFPMTDDVIEMFQHVKSLSKKAA